MRIWGYTAPALLCRKHLLGEHNELHVMLKIIDQGDATSGWGRHPETKRFRDYSISPSCLPPEFVVEGYSYLLFRHEMLRIEMSHRWEGKHDPINHLTPVTPRDKVDKMMMRLALVGNNGFWSSNLKGAALQQDFEHWMKWIAFPRTLLEHDTPWERDDVPMQWYIDNRDTWSWKAVQQYHEEREAQGAGT